MEARPTPPSKYRAATIASLAITLAIGATWAIDRQGVGRAAGTWTVRALTPAPDGTTLPAPVGTRLTISPSGHFAFPQGDGVDGVIGRSLCGWSCFAFRGLRYHETYRVELDGPDTLRLSDASGLRLVAVRQRDP